MSIPANSLAMPFKMQKMLAQKEAPKHATEEPCCTERHSADIGHGLFS
jgi:hypothetical protein